jgi:antibiotic biosynthesis monooxygenase (ABM) superfamily enzyme
MSSAGTTIVTQTCPAPEHAEAFAAWQQETSKAVAEFPGFVRQTVIPPSPPTQVDWVILQHFADRQCAVAWLRSDARLQRVAAVQALVIGHDDVHLVAGDGPTLGQSPVSAVISTRVKQGQETAYRQWEQRIAAAQARAAGFLGYRLEPPIPGVQEDWLAVVKFDSAEHLQDWLSGAERARLLTETAPFTEEYHTRIAQTGFDRWFDVTKGGGEAPAARWKQNMVVLLLLYPVVFLFGWSVQTPWLIGRAGLAFPVALFLGNVVSVVLLSYLVAPTSRCLRWWLQPQGSAPTRIAIAGTFLIVVLYGAMVAAFTWWF